MANKFIILSDAIQSGKTSKLLTWINGKNNIAGILTPDVDGKRMLYDIANNATFDFETNTEELREVEIVGRFIFLKSSFKKAQDILIAAVLEQPEWLIIDEVGKLELMDKGLEPKLRFVIESFKINSPKTTIILIVRDYLVEQVILKYGLGEAKIVGQSYFID